MFTIFLRVSHIIAFLQTNLNYILFILCVLFNQKKTYIHFSKCNPFLRLMRSSLIEESSQSPNIEISDTSNAQQKSIKKSKPLISKTSTKKSVKIEENNHNSFNFIEPPQSDKAQTCINRICPNKNTNSFKTYHNKNTVFDPNQLCFECWTQYKKKAYCMYCRQIYFDESDDGKEWILCDQCMRWVHSQCANYDSTFDEDFKCIKCRKHQREENNRTMIKKQGIRSNQKSGDRRKLTECNLNAYGFFWQLRPKQLAEDMNKIRQYLN